MLFQLVVSLFQLVVSLFQLVFMLFQLGLHVIQTVTQPFVAALEFLILSGQTRDLICEFLDLFIFIGNILVVILLQLSDLLLRSLNRGLNHRVDVVDEFGTVFNQKDFPESALVPFPYGSEQAEIESDTFLFIATDPKLDGNPNFVILIVAVRDHVLVSVL